MAFEVNTNKDFVTIIPIVILIGGMYAFFYFTGGVATKEDVIKNGLESIPSVATNQEVQEQVIEYKERINNGGLTENIMDVKKGEKYLTKSGLKFEVLTLGEGQRPTINDRVKVHYHGTLENGTVFDSSVERGQQIEFPLNGVIVGWQEGLTYMPVGSKFKFTIPANLAYGDQSPSPAIPANSTLIFEVELFEIK